MERNFLGDFFYIFLGYEEYFVKGLEGLVWLGRFYVCSGGMDVLDAAVWC